MSQFFKLKIIFSFCVLILFTYCLFMSFKRIISNKIIQTSHKIFQPVKREGNQQKNAKKGKAKIIFHICYNFVLLLQFSFGNQRMKARKETEDYTFCYNQENPTSIVMLAPPYQIMEKFFTDYQETFYFWMYSNKADILEFIKRQFSQIEERSWVFENAQQIFQFLQENIQFTKIILICPPNIAQDELKIFKTSKFVGILIYEFKMGPQRAEQITEQIQIQDSQNRKLSKCNSFEDLRLLLKINLWCLNKCKVYPNFLTINKEIGSSKIFVNTLKSMINQELDDKTRNMLVKKLQMVTKMLQKTHPKLRFQTNPTNEALKRMQNKLSAREILEIYTQQNSQIYFLVNGFLRAMNCPTEFYYVQPFVQDLYNTIKQLNMKIKDHEELLVFRGGKTSLEEASELSKSVGEVIQNLGFLSTSLVQTVALNFKINAFFQIKVLKNKNLSSLYNHGYAMVKQYSSYAIQQQIIFNPLNYFKIKQVKIHHSPKEEIQQLYFIKLEFGEINTYFSLPQEELNEDMKIMKMLIRLHQEQSKQIIYQGLIWRGEDGSREKNSVALRYWYKYWQVLQNLLPKKIQEFRSQDTISKCRLVAKLKRQKGPLYKNYFYAMSYTAKIQLSMHRYRQAYQIFKKYLQVQKMFLGNASQNYFASLASYASTLSLLKKYDESIQCHNQCLLLLRQIGLENHQYYLTIFGNLGTDLKHIGLFQQALQIQNQCFQKKIKKFGKSHPESIKTLLQLGEIKLHLGKYHQALNIMQECSKMQKKSLGENHIQYINSLILITITLKSLGRIQQCIATANLCKKKIQENFGNQHPLKLFLFEIEAVTCLEIGKYERSVVLYKNLGKTQENYKYLGVLSNVFYAVNMFAPSLLYCQKFKEQQPPQIIKQAKSENDIVKCERSIKLKLKNQNKKVKKAKGFSDFF